MGNSSGSIKNPGIWTARLPWLMAIAIFISVIWVDFNHKFWNAEERVIFWDVKTYYVYLPAAIIYKDLGMNFKDKDPEKFNKNVWVAPTDIGRYVSKMSMGVSFAYAPFFILAHWLAGPLGYETDGYSIPYKFALVMSSAAYLLLGMFLLIYVLRRWFSPWIVGLVVLGITVGTNLYYYSSIEAAMSHTYSFALFAGLLLATVRWHERPSILRALMIGLLAGWITLIRPTNIIVVLIPLLWGIGSERGISGQISLFVRKYPHVIIMIVAGFLIWVPQLLYWKYTTGAWLFYSYGDERFFFLRPAIADGLFSYRKGWLLYTPIMVLALAGIPPLRKRLPAAFWPVLLFTVLNIYIVLSWWSWWYGGSFGLRAFIDSYAFLALPLASFLSWVFSQRVWFRVATTIVVLVLVWHSIFQTMQYYYGAIHWDGMNRAAYWNSFLRLRPSGEFYGLITPPETLDEAIARRGK